MHFDLSYHPIVAGKWMFIASSRNDCLIALDAESGEEKWRFHADGPVRLAPAAWNGSVYFVSDDGHLRCVDAEHGSLQWKFFGGWTGRKCIGNERMISSWPARGGPVIADGKVYFAAGIWPFMGIFIHALDARTGKRIWTSSNTGYVEAAPQGHLVVVGDKLLVPCSRTKPVCLDRETGRFLHYYGAKIHHSRDGNGSWRVWGVGKYFVNDGAAFDLTSRRWALRLGAS
jgi:outer membrane protein assembly factor BamB